MLPRIGILYKITQFKEKCLLFVEINNSLKLLNAFHLQSLRNINHSRAESCWCYEVAWCDTSGLGQRAAWPGWAEEPRARWSQSPEPEPSPGTAAPQHRGTAAAGSSLCTVMRTAAQAAPRFCSDVFPGPFEKGKGFWIVSWLTIPSTRCSLHAVRRVSSRYSKTLENGLLLSWFAFKMNLKLSNHVYIKRNLLSQGHCGALFIQVSLGNCKMLSSQSYDHVKGKG